MSALSIGFPSKGRLQEQALAFLQDCGLPLSAGEERSYSARIPAAPEAEVRLLSAGEIARGLAAGELHAGVTGEDVLREAAPNLDGVALAAPLGFGRADLLVAAPQSWLDVSSMADLAEVCAAHRARTGRRLRVATKYVRQAGAFFARHGIEDFRIVESAGATEGAPASGSAEVVVDISTTGRTLAANGLAPLSDGLILRSQAHLAVSLRAGWSGPAQAGLERILEIMEARAAAKRWRFLRVLVGAQGLEAALAASAPYRAHADAEVLAEGIGFYCRAEQAADAARALAPFSLSPVGVYEPQHLFDGRAASVARLRSLLGEGEARAPELAGAAGGPM
jgi:ATP phosphoribosyltransferase